MSQSNSKAELNTKPRISLAERLRAGTEFLFTLRLGETVFHRQWTEYLGTDEQRHEFRFYWETYLTAIGGGETVKAASILQTDEYFRPVSYEVFSDRMPLRRAVFKGQMTEATLADDSVITLRFPSDPDFVLQNNVLAQISLFLSTFPTRGLSVIESTYFSPESLAVRNVKFERIDENTGDSAGVKWSSSLGAELLCDHENQIVRLIIPKANVSGEFEPAPFPKINFPALREGTISTYKPPLDANFTLGEITFEAQGVEFGAALTVPHSSERKKHPALLFIQGSGRHDRHGMAPGIDTGTHHIVDYLSNNGYVSLRFDSRGSGNTGYGQLLDIRYETLVNEAKAAFRVLEQRPEVSSEELFIIGHSLGALTALRLALAREQLPIKGLVLLAPPGRPFDEILTQQALREAQRLGFTETQISERQKNLSDYFRGLRNEQVGEDPAKEASQFGLHTKVIRDLVEIDPGELVVKVRIPILICQGWKDIQVSVELDTLRLVRAAGDSGDVNMEVRLFPNLDHLFKVEPGVSLPERYYVDRPIGSDFLKSVLTWLDAQRTS